MQNAMPLSLFSRKEGAALLVRMRSTTNFNGLKLAGNEYEVPHDTGARWVNNGIAEPVSVSEQEQEVGYEAMEARQLYRLCKEQGIELDKEHMKKKAYLIAMLKGEQSWQDE